MGKIVSLGTDNGEIAAFTPLGPSLQGGLKLATFTECLTAFVIQFSGCLINMLSFWGGSSSSRDFRSGPCSKSSSTDPSLSVLLLAVTPGLYNYCPFQNFNQSSSPISSKDPPGAPGPLKVGTSQISHPFCASIERFMCKAAGGPLLWNV